MKFYFLIIISIFSLFTKAQTKLDLAIKNLEENYAQEKIYILFNKEDYIAGENIWFKAFVFDGYKQSNISTNLFVELYDKNKTLIDKKLLPIISGQSDGSFILKDDLEENVYYLRAYTTYMTYFSEEFQYIKPLLIYNPKSKLKLVKNNDLKWNASVYPEGGTFIENQTTKFAVRLKSIGGLPEKWNGFVFEKNNPSTKIIKFNNIDENIASFYLRAEPSKTYQLQVNDENGNQQIIDLPIAKKDGIKLEVILSSDSIRYTIKGVNKTLKNYNVVGTINNDLAYKATIVNNKQIFSSKLPLSINNNQNAILNLNVFNENNDLVAQRLVFLNSKKDEESAIKTKFLSKKIILNKKDYSMLYAASINTNSSINNDFESFLWLTSDIKSTITNPSQYFQNNDKLNNLDVLLISEKWNRTTWNELFTKQKANKVDSTYLSYTGNVIMKEKKVANSSINLILETDNNSKDLIQVQTDELGKFTLDKIIAYDNFYLTYYSNEKNNPISINLLSNNSFIPYKKTFEAINYSLLEKSEEDLIKNISSKKIPEKSRQSEIELKQVDLYADNRKKTELLDKKLSSPAFQAGTRKIIDFVNEKHSLSTYQSVIQWLIYNQPALKTVLIKGEVELTIRNNGFPLKIYQNEQRIAAEDIPNINVHEVVMIKFITNAIIGDAICIYTNTKNISSQTNNSNNNSNNKIELTGYDKSTPFVNDNYNILYWNPNLISEPNKETIIEYYNNDKPKDYQLTIIGFDEKGNPVYYEGKIN
ncbi:hypothetical protein ACTS94_11370 [Empedobacter falsenii]